MLVTDESGDIACIQQFCSVGCVNINNPDCNTIPFTDAYLRNEESGDGSGNTALSSATAITTAVTSAFTGPPLPAACSTVQYFYSFCNSVTPSFGSLAPSAQASCLCYSNNTWSPNSLDIPYSSCIAFLNSIEPAATSALTALNSELGFCASVGNVNNASSTVGGAPITLTAASRAGSGLGGGRGNSTPTATGTEAPSAAGSGISAATGSGTQSSTASAASATTTKNGAAAGQAKGDGRMFGKLGVGLVLLVWLLALL